MSFGFVAKEVARLSQEEGLNDREISEVLGCSRVTVSRIRRNNEIPTANLDNKMDKSYICNCCKETIYIRRYERRRLLCSECKQLSDEEVIYMREKNKIEKQFLEAKESEEGAS